jgi:hypothetical protein
MIDPGEPILRSNSPPLTKILSEGINLGNDDLNRRTSELRNGQVRKQATVGRNVGPDLKETIGRRTDHTALVLDPRVDEVDVSIAEDYQSVSRR